MKSATPSFKLMVAGLKQNESSAAEVIYKKFINQMVFLATSKLSNNSGRIADPESVAMSVFESFFERNLNKQFEFSNWEMVYGLLAHITFRKCLNKNRFNQSKKRNPLEMVVFEDWQKTSNIGPDQEIIMKETLQTALNLFEPDEKAILDLFLKGEPSKYIAEKIDFSTRTIQRVIEKFRVTLEKMANDSINE